MPSSAESDDEWQSPEDSESDFDIENPDESEDAGDDSGLEDDFEPTPKKRKAPAVPKKSPASAKAKAEPKAKAAPKPSPSKKTTPAKRKSPADDGADGTPVASPSPAKKAKVPSKAAASAASAAPASVVSSAASRAPPKVKAVTGKSAEDLVLQYIMDSNRPFSSNLLYDNLHGAVGKTLLSKILDKYAETGQLRAKSWGKTKLYWPNQDQFEESNSPETLAELDAELREVQAKLAEAKREVAELAGEVKALEGQPTEAEADRQIAAAENALAAKKARLEKYAASNKTALTKEQVNKITEQFKTYFKHWKLRRAATNEILDLILENISKTKKKLISDLGLETEEDQNISYAEYLEEFRKL